MACTGSASPCDEAARRSSASNRPLEKSLRDTAATVSRTACASTNRSNRLARSTLRRDRPSTFSNAALAKTMMPSVPAMATIVASWLSAA